MAMTDRTPFEPRHDTMSAVSIGASIEEAAYIGNYAGGLVCENVGIVPIEFEELFRTISANNE